VAERAGAVVGMVTASERYYTSWAGSTLYVQDIYVDPPHRGRGIGTALLGCVAALALERGSPLVELTVRADSPARRLYRRVGFQQVNCASYVAAGAGLATLGHGYPEPFSSGGCLTIAVRRCAVRRHSRRLTATGGQLPAAGAVARPVSP
jgi:hypothetical protein